MLKRAITSVLEQTYENVEILVVNDGSSDDTSFVVKELQSQFANIKYFENKEAKGACNARNIAISNASGEFITGLDDDDELLPNHLEVLLECFLQSQCSFVASSIIEDTGKGRFYRNSHTGYIDLPRVLHNNPVGNQIFTRTKWLADLGGFDESMPASQDYDMWVRFIDTYGKGLKLESATYIWHTGHEGNRITGNYSKRLQALDIFYTKHHSLMSKSNKKSYRILKYKSNPDGFNFFRLAENINCYNYKSALSLYFQNNLPWFSSFWQKLKSTLFTIRAK